MKRLFLLLVTIISCLFNNILLAQIQPLWSTDYSLNYPFAIHQNSMVNDKNGNVYIVGFTNDTSNNNVKGVTLKYNTNGQFQWIQYYDSINYYTRIAVDDSSNVYVAGRYDNGLKTLKYNSLGVLKWARTYPSSGYGIWAWDLITDDSCNVYITGHSTGNRFTTLKYNVNGNLEWASLDTIASGQGPSLITLDNAQNVYIAIRGFDVLNSSFTSTTIKYNSAGVKVWQKSNNGNFVNGAAFPVQIKYHPHGYIYVLASSTNSSNSDYNVVKYDTLGNLIWTSSYSFTDYYDIPKDFIFDKYGNIYVTGNIYPTGGTYDSLATIKISKLGTFEWKRTYSSGYSMLDEACGISIDTLGYIYVAGKSPDSFYNENFLTIKYDSLGNEIWIARYKHTISSYDMPNTISIDNAGNIYLSGRTTDLNSTGILTLKYSKTVGLIESKNEKEPLVNTIPNPFETCTMIVSNQELKDASILLYDELGKEVFKINHINQRNIIIPRNNLSNGIYFFRLLENGQIIAKGKIIAQ